MKRRAVIKAGVGGLVGMAALESGCATVPGRPEPAPEAVDPAVAEAALARIDERMASFAELDFDIPENLPHHVHETLSTRAEMTRKTLRTLYLAGAFHQLDEPLRYHPGVQERIRRMQGEMDTTVQRVTDHLASLSPAERKQIQQRLAAEPELGSSVAQHLHDVAKEDSFRFGQRAQLRYTLGDLERRMRTQSSAVIDRSVQRTRTTYARANPMDERTYAAQMGEGAFRDLKQRALGYAASWEHVYAARPRFDLARIDELYPGQGGGFRQVGSSIDPPQSTSASGGINALTVAGWMLGIGAIVEATGLILFFGAASASFTAAQTVGLIMCVYIGPTLLALGLIVGLVGLIIAIATPRPSVSASPGVTPGLGPTAPQPAPGPQI